MNIITIHPVPGRTVRDPDTGIEVKGPTPVNEHDAFWIRCISSGDVSKTPVAPAKEIK